MASLRVRPRARSRAFPSFTSVPSSSAPIGRTTIAGDDSTPPNDWSTCCCTGFPRVRTSASAPSSSMPSPRRPSSAPESGSGSAGFAGLPESPHGDADRWSTTTELPHRGAHSGHVLAHFCYARRRAERGARSAVDCGAGQMLPLAKQPAPIKLKSMSPLSDARLLVTVDGHTASMPSPSLSFAVLHPLARRRGQIGHSRCRRRHRSSSSPLARRRRSRCRCSRSA